MVKKAVCIMSGGMDSITLLYDRQDDIALGISFDYGSNHNAREIPLAAMHCKRLGIPHIVINLDFMQRHFESSLLQGADAIPEGHYAADNMQSTVVPFRNGIMLAIAIGVAESHGLTQVFIANHGGVVAPYTNISKADIARIGKRLGLNYAETWSCYKGGAHHCGKCGTCIERKEALQAAGIDDPTPYDA